MASPSVKRPRAANLEKFRESLGAPNWNEPSGAENEE
jgi:hypothetical protein